MATTELAPHCSYETDLVYGTAPLAGAEVALRLDLARPTRATGPVPLVLWLHAGGFRSGDKAWAGHRTDARWYTKAGYAFASVNYRLQAKNRDLSEAVRARLPALERRRDPRFRQNLSGAASMAALEDALAALRWLHARRHELGLADWIALGGTSAGAITAFNAVFLPGFFGLARPPIRALISISGGFAYPGLYAPAAVPIHALHCPSDPRVDIAFIRDTADAGGPDVELIEAPEQGHGRIRLHREEPAREAYARLIGFLDRARETG